MRKLYSWEEHKKELMKDPEFRAEYEKLETEFMLARQVIGQRIKQKMTQSELAKKAGTNQVVISRIETGDANPTLGSMKKISKAFGKKLEIKMVSR